MGEVFRGSEAIEAGYLTRQELRRWYRTVFRGIYIPKRHNPTLHDLTMGAWLYSLRQGVVSVSQRQHFTAPNGLMPLRRSN
jgi:hypothetical protein